MNAHAWLVLAVYTAILVALSIPMGRYIAHVMEGRLRLAGRIEGALYRLCGIRCDAEMGWLQYALAILLFNGLGAASVNGFSLWTILVAFLGAVILLGVMRLLGGNGLTYRV